MRDQSLLALLVGEDDVACSRFSTQYSTCSHHFVRKRFNIAAPHRNADVTYTQFGGKVLNQFRTRRLPSN
jgi:hypothetical protein